MARDSFLHLTDFHFWEVIHNPFRMMNKRVLGNFNVWRKRRHEFILERAKPYLEEVASTGLKTALLTGDFSSTATPGEFQAGADFVRSLEEFGIEAIAYPGNHDVYTRESVRRRRFEQYFDAWYPEEALPARRKLPGGTDLVLVPTVSPDYLSRGRITSIEVAGVSELLRSVSGPIVVSGHYPLLNETQGYTTPPARQLRNAEALRAALGDYGAPILYVAGHVHRFSYTQDADFPQLQHLTTGAFLRTAKETNSEGEFSVVEIEGDSFSVTRHVKRETWAAEVAELGALGPRSAS